MAINVVATPEYIRQTMEGALLAKAVLTITGLTPASANTIPHGLVGAPLGVPIYQATSGTPGFETFPPDGTYIYYTTGAGQTSLRVEVEY